MMKVQSVELDLEHEIPALSCDVERLLGIIVCDTIAHIVVEIVIQVIILLFHNCHFSQPEWRKIDGFLNYARGWINAHHAVEVEDVGPNIAIDELELVDHGLVLAVGLLHRELAHLLKSLGINARNFIGTVRDIEDLLYSVNRDAPALFYAWPHLDGFLLVEGVCIEQPDGLLVPGQLDQRVRVERTYTLTKVLRVVGFDNSRLNLFLLVVDF